MTGAGVQDTSLPTEPDTLKRDHGYPAGAAEAILLERFRERSAALGVRVETAADVRQAAAHLGAIAQDWSNGDLVFAAEVAVQAPNLVRSLGALGVKCLPAGDPALTRDAPLGLSVAHAAIAETGSVLLAESSLADRAIGMLCLAQVVLCPTGALVADLDGAVAVLRKLAHHGPSYATFVTGPSRTADIERVLTVGVQGPAQVAIVFVDRLT